MAMAIAATTMAVAAEATTTAVAVVAMTMMTMTTAGAIAAMAADLGKNILHNYWNFIFPPIMIAFAVGCAINKNTLQYIAIYCCFMLRIPSIQLLLSTTHISLSTLNPSTPH
jgi:hypothetical protein